jgi:hypothetical protein
MNQAEIDEIRGRLKRVRRYSYLALDPKTGIAITPKPEFFELIMRDVKRLATEVETCWKQ